ncbi:DUF2487 family protein [Pseudogracilibacillus sp. SE30717A]|uniref:DUF2487 family protein n=1 Tax=Pseudogracilibacillus sp. SE30717A TaxID=3098293 RepID=UPI00300E3A3B
MKWITDDLKKYVQAKEYIDTLIIPLETFHMSQEASFEKDAFQKEVLSIYTNEIEKELSGRVLLSPTYSYLKKANLEQEAERLNQWINDIKEQPFTLIFAITLDNQWKKIEKNLDCELLWLPAMKPSNIKSEEAVKLIRSQVEQISELIRSYW